MPKFASATHHKRPVCNNIIVPFKPKDNINPESINALARFLAWYFSRRQLSLDDFKKYMQTLTAEELDTEFAKGLYEKYCEEIERTEG